MRYVGAVSWLFATVVLFLAAGPAAGQMGGNVLVQGSPYGTLSSVDFDDSGRLHVARGYSILIIDPETGNLAGELGWDELCTESSQCVYPEDLAFGPDGSLYFAGYSGVGRRTEDGVTTVQYVAPDVSSIAFSHDGRLFAAAYGSTGDELTRLYEVDPELIQEPQLLWAMQGQLRGVDIGPDGLLYGAVWTEDRVLRIDTVADPPTVETVLDGRYVSAVKFDSQGRLIATDFGSGEVLRADVDTGVVEVIAQLAEGLSDLAFDSTGRLYVSSFRDGFIVEVPADGDARTVVPGGLAAPWDVSVVPGPEGDRVFVADGWSLREIDGATGQQLGLTNVGFAPGGLRYPIRTVAPYGDALVVTSGGIVQVFDPDRGTILEEHTDFASSQDAISFRGDLVVAEIGESFDTRRVLRVSSSGIETLIDQDQGLGIPVALAATEEDLWVGDAINGRVWQVIAGGETLATPILVITELWPNGLAVDGAGRLLAATRGGGLRRVDPQTGVASNLVDVPDERWLCGVDLGSSRAVYVTGCSGPRALYRFDLETFYIPAAAHKAGAAGTQWVTDLTIHNQADTGASFSIDLLPKRQDNSAPETVSFSLGPSSSVGYDDALDELFGFSGAAALRVRATSGDLIVGSRTYNDQPDGTFGQFIAGYPEDEALVSGDQGLLIGLSHGADYRTNIGFASACGGPISVNVTLHAADGAQLGQKTVELAPYSYNQVTDIFGDLSSGDVADGFAVVESSSPGARYFAYASVIDNRTGDAVYIPAR